MSYSPTKVVFASVDEMEESGYKENPTGASACDHTLFPAIPETYPEAGQCSTPYCKSYSSLLTADQCQGAAMVLNGPRPEPYRTLLGPHPKRTESFSAKQITALLLYFYITCVSFVVEYIYIQQSCIYSNKGGR